MPHSPAKRYYRIVTSSIPAELLVDSQRDYGVDLCGAARGNVRWQAHTEGAYDPSHFVIDWDGKKVTCPKGHTSLSWTPAIDNRDNSVIKIKFARGTCRVCTDRNKCTRQERRSLTIRPREQHEALIANRARQTTPAFKAEQARRSGIEGTLSFGIRACQMRRSRYIGLAKTHLQHCMIAAVMNLVRVTRWLAGEPRAKTRVTPFQQLQLLVV